MEGKTNALATATELLSKAEEIGNQPRRHLAGEGPDPDVRQVALGVLASAHALRALAAEVSSLRVEVTRVAQALENRP